MAHGCYCSDFDDIACEELQSVLAERARDAQKELDRKKRELKGARDDLKEHAECNAGRGNWRPYRSVERLYSEIDKVSDEIDRLEANVEGLPFGELGKIEFGFERQFEEHDVGVILQVHAHACSPFHDIKRRLYFSGAQYVKRDGGVGIELKPAVGDDYHASIHWAASPRPWRAGAPRARQFGNLGA
jgi:hypothetical protein